MRNKLALRSVVPTFCALDSDLLQANFMYHTPAPLKRARSSASTSQLISTTGIRVATGGKALPDEAIYGLILTKHEKEWLNSLANTVVYIETKKDMAIYEMAEMMAEYGNFVTVKDRTCGFWCHLDSATEVSLKAIM